MEMCNRAPRDAAVALCVLPIRIAPRYIVASMLGGRALRGWRWMGRLLLVLVCLRFPAAARAQVGDANCDGTVDAVDVDAASSLMFSPSVVFDCPRADANADGRLTSADLTAIVRIFAPPARGPVVSYLGLATPDGRPLGPVDTWLGRPVFFRPVGSGFQLVVEGRAGANDQRPGSVVFASDPRDPSKRPDLQVLVQRPLGDGSPEVCAGGVPGFDPPDFGPALAVSQAINDLGCNFTLSMQGGCTVNSYGQPSLVNRTSQIQYCATISRALAFPFGDTIVAVRLRDTSGVLGPIESIVVRVGASSPTATATAAVSPSASPTLSRTPTLFRSATPSHTAPPTDTPVGPTATRSASPTPPASITPTRTITATSASRSPSPTPSRSRSPSQASPSPTSPVSTPTRSPTVRPTATATRTVPAAPSPTRTATRTATRTTSPTATQGADTTRGPLITYFGLTRADDTPIEPTGTNAEGIPVFSRLSGAGFSLVIEGRPGNSGSPVGSASFREGGAPDLLVVVSRPLGDGSPSVCDRLPPNTGGVPAIEPPDFTDRPEVIAALNDLGCRFLDGAGQPRARNRNDACILRGDGSFDFANSSSTVQFCGFVDIPIRFPPGDTVVTARLRDTAGNLGPAARIVVRVAP